MNWYLGRVWTKGPRAICLCSLASIWRLQPLNRDCNRDSLYQSTCPVAMNTEPGMSSRPPSFLLDMDGASSLMRTVKLGEDG